MKWYVKELVVDGSKSLVSMEGTKCYTCLQAIGGPAQGSLTRGCGGAQLTYAAHEVAHSIHQEARVRRGEGIPQSRPTE